MKNAFLCLPAILFLLLFTGCFKLTDTESGAAGSSYSLSSETAQTDTTAVTTTGTTECTTTTVTAFDRAYVPEYHGEPYCEINNSLPFFKEGERTTESFERYSPLDALGRCGVCEACIGQEMMPAEKRGSIGAVKPSGWQLVRYDGLVNGNYLYNRCHLIGFMLTGQNANACNLITGTRYLNKEGMLPFEILTADYIRETGNHVLYRVTPIFEGDHLLADGVLMEALSVEDDGDGIRFNVFCYNVQPQIVIDYATGESRLADDAAERALPVTGETTVPAETTATETTAETTTEPAAESTETSLRQMPDAADSEAEYILNTNTRRFHRPDCQSVPDISERNKAEYTGSREALIAEGYEPCGRCHP